MSARRPDGAAVPGPAAAPVRVVVVDDQTLVREGIRALLSIGEVEVVGEADDGRRALEVIDAVDPDVVLLDLRMPAYDGIWAVDRAHGTHEDGVEQVAAVAARVLEVLHEADDAEAEARRARDGVVPGINFPKGRPAGAPQVQGYGQSASGPAQGGFAPQNQGYNDPVQGGFPAAQNAGTWGGPQS